MVPDSAELRKVVHRIKSLTIEVPFPEAWQKFVSGIGEAPKFIHLQFPAWPLPAEPPAQLSTVTSLIFDTPFIGLDIPALFPLIKAVPILQYFISKAVDVVAESDPNYSNIVSVPQLRTIDVTIPGFGLDFLCNFHAPLLTQVRLDGYREVVPDSYYDWGLDVSRPASNTLTYLSAHSPDIRRLELKYVQFEHPKEDFISILSGQALPVLEELIMERTNIPDAALIECGRHSSLKKVELRNCRYISANGLRSFVQAITNTDLVLIVEGCPEISRELEDAESLSKVVHVESN